MVNDTSSEIEIFYRAVVKYDIFELNKTELNFFTGNIREQKNKNFGFPIRNITFTNRMQKEAISLYSIHTEDDFLKITKQFLPYLVLPNE